MLFSILTTAYWVGVVAIAGAVGILSLVYVAQEKLIYFPDTQHFLAPSRYGFADQDWKEVMLRASDGITIQTWLFKQKKPKACPTIIFCHSNAGNLSHRLPNIKQLFDVIGVNVFIISYRGYGKSEGVPTENGIKLDLDVSIEYLLSSDEVDSNRLCIFGRSLGGAVAVDASYRYPQHIKANILENTFLSIPEMVDVVLPQLKFFKPLCRNKWNSYLTIREIRTPILFLSGQNDELVPSAHMKRLKEEAVNSVNTNMIIFDKGGHMNLMLQPNYYDHIKEFLENVFGIWR
ncbi:hypothetical protein DFA_09542 [Cavenderia fasciculata]|uniref:Serine aminopeptidase S33 domain-containing protein n=1 Tax=Cavenderia fasciculata TaxID=261658 RepID=F4Q7X3_CACFS|nr:uncharacterized protein DFA_09542 [Cavenderia fasciculata]EGG15873.1 hypothetical protein DFA_09542 [Cavenderia fasciculata]|eukprot:XP_004352198.1 hypothetical protein DFA_09542 [Cavenderia fasciculata]